MVYGLDKFEFGIVANEKKEPTNLCIAKEIPFFFNFKKGKHVFIYRSNRKSSKIIFCELNRSKCVIENKSFQIKKLSLPFESDQTWNSFSSFLISSTNTLNFSSKKETYLWLSTQNIVHYISVIGIRKIEIKNSEVFYYQLKSGINQFNRPPPFYDV